VRVQRERGQKVISTGLYTFVRHSAYAGLTVWFPGTALLLSSVFGLVIALTPMALFVARTVLEDGVLHREREGYDAYAERVRYRLVPGIW